jgi:mxaJ protein
MSSHCPERGRALAAARAAALGAAVFLLLAAVPPTRLLRVCADPNNLPFSNRRGQGFENRLATLVGRELGARVVYTWWPQRRGFIRSTLDAGRCDVVMGVPSDYERVLPTRPYYTSSYVFVARKDRGLRVRSFDDPVLRRLRIGVQLIAGDGAETPATHALGLRGLSDNLVGYPVTGNYAEPNPPARIVDAVARGDVDLAVVWGPLAGYFARREPVPLEITPVDERLAGPGMPLAFSIAMGVRRDDTRLRAELDSILLRRGAEITRILDSYHVPRIDPPRHEATGDTEAS